MTKEDLIVLCEEAIDKIDELCPSFYTYGELGIVMKNLSDIRAALVNNEV